MYRLNPFVILVVVLVASANSQAAYIRVPVPNNSFELPGTSKQQCWDGEKPGSTDIPGWSSDIVAIDSGVECEPGSTNGKWVAYLMGNQQANGDPSIWNLLPYVIKDGDQFILTVDARNNCDAAVLKMSFYYQDDDGKRITVATKTVELTGSFKTYFLRFAADNVPDSVGHELGIELDNPSTGWLGIDNVQIPQSNVPNSVGRALSIESNNSLLFGAKGISATGTVPAHAAPVIIPEPSTIIFFLFGGLIILLRNH